jgi:peroxiredoxin
MYRLKYLLASLLIVFAGASASAKDGYKIHVKFTDAKDTLVYLVHYYAEPLPKIYKADSVRLDKKGEGVLQSNKETLGGIYMLLLSDMKTVYEFLLNNGDEFGITATASKVPTGISFKGSPENDHFLEYEQYLMKFSERQQPLQAELAAAKTKADTAAVGAKQSAASKELTAYRRSLVQKYSGTLLSTILDALEVPEVPPAPKKKDGTVDSMFSYLYYKNHYWDHFNFKDDRLIHTPIFDAKLNEYFNRLVLPVPDSVNKEADTLLARTRGRKELFKYTLWWTTRFAEQSKVMGMDQAFVNLVEKYYARGDAYWLPDSTVQKYLDRIAKIGPNMIGKVAPELVTQGIDGKPKRLSDVKAKYTILLFFAPDCGHCITEVPKLDSVYQAALKAKGVKVYAVRTEGPEKLWREFIQKNHLEEWTNTWDPQYTSNFRSKYDIYSTPVIYLLDEKKIIRGKRLDHSNILQVVEMLDKKAAAEATGKL